MSINNPKKGLKYSPKSQDRALRRDESPKKKYVMSQKNSKTKKDIKSEFSKEEVKCSKEYEEAETIRPKTQMKKAPIFSKQTHNEEEKEKLSDEASFDDIDRIWDRQRIARSGDMQIESHIEKDWNVLVHFQETMNMLQSEAFEKWITKTKKEGAYVLDAAPTPKRGSSHNHKQTYPVYYTMFQRVNDLKSVCQEFENTRFFLLNGVCFDQLGQVEEKDEDEDLANTLLVCLSDREEKAYYPIFVLKNKLTDTFDQDEIDLLPDYFENLKTKSPLGAFYGVLVDSLNASFVGYDIDSRMLCQSKKFVVDIRHELLENKKPSDDLMQMFRIIVSMLAMSVSEFNQLNA